MRYARSDVRGFSGVNGCPGHTEASDPDHAEHFTVDCGLCDPFLAADPLWAGTASEVPLTRSEEKDLDAKQKEAERGAAEMGLAMQALLREQLAKSAAQPAAEPDPEPKPRRTRAPRKAAAKD